MSAMTVFDYLVLGIIGFSILVGLMRGAIRELFSVLGWVLAFYLANRFNGEVISYMPEQIPGDAVKALAAFLVVFLLVLFVSTLLALLLTTLIKAVGLGGLNRVLGGLAGIVKGMLVEIGNVLVQKDNIFSETRPVDEAYLDLLREGCLATGGKPLPGIDRGDEQNADHPDNQPISSLA